MQRRPSLSMHWDKDEEMRVATGVFVHPHLSTVTYLKDGRAPQPALIGRQGLTAIV